MMHFGTLTIYNAEVYRTSNRKCCPSRMRHCNKYYTCEACKGLEIMKEIVWNNVMDIVREQY